jgi:hypothetical protein
LVLAGQSSTPLLVLLLQLLPPGAQIVLVVRACAEDEQTIKGA